MPPKRTTSKSPAPETTATSPVKASPKRATSAKKAAPSASPKASPKAVPASKKPPTKKDVVDDVVSNGSESDDDMQIDASAGASLFPSSQTQLTSSQQSVNNNNEKQSPAPASKRAPSPKKSVTPVVTTSKTQQQQPQKQQQQNADDADAINDSIRVARLAETHENPKAKQATVEAAKRCAKLGVAVHAVYDYLKKKAADVTKNANNNNKASSSAATQQDSVDDVLALFGPQKNASSSGIGALSTQNEKLQQSIAANQGVPITQVSVEFSFIRAPTPSRIPWSVVLPNPVHDIEKSICLITPAPQDRHRMIIEGEANNAKDSDDFVQAPPNIQKIMGIDKLEGRFQDPVALRALAKSYSAFWVHNECDHFPRVFAGEFMSHHFPVWVNGKKSLHINERLNRTLGCVMVPRQGHDNVTVVVGHTKQTEAQLAENVRTFCGNVVALLEQSWQDVLSIRLSFKDFGSDRRIVLPIYAHDFKESHQLGTDAAVAPKPIKKLPTLARLMLATEEAKKLKKEAGQIRQRADQTEEKGTKAIEVDAGKKEGTQQQKKPANSAAATVKPAAKPASKSPAKAPVAAVAAGKKSPAAKPSAKPSSTSASATSKPPVPRQQQQEKKLKEDAASVVVAETQKKNDTAADSDDDIPQIDASPAASAKTAIKKPAPKGKKVGGKK